MRYFIIAIIILILLHAYSCTKMQVEFDPKKTYKMELDISISGKSGSGMVWSPQKDFYNIEIFAEEKMDVVLFRTCSREVVVRDPKRILNRKRFNYFYQPNEIEADGFCPVYINALNAQGYYQNAFIDISDKNTTLPAKIVCGSTTETTTGVSVCQERIGSAESISFDVEVATSPSPECFLESGTRGKKFDFNIKKGFCDYIFIEKAKPNRMHRLTTYGYDDIKFRE